MSVDGVGRVIRALRGHSKAPDFESHLCSSFFFFFSFACAYRFYFYLAHIVSLLNFCAQRFFFYYFLLFVIILVVILSHDVTTSLNYIITILSGLRLRYANTSSVYICDHLDF